MKTTGVRAAWLREREEISARAIREKNSQSAIRVMANRYQSLVPSDQQIIKGLFIDQLSSGDETVRFDALALIREFRITEAAPALRRLAERLEGENTPGAPYEWELVNRIRGSLGTVSSD